MNRHIPEISKEVLIPHEIEQDLRLVGVKEVALLDVEELRPLFRHLLHHGDCLLNATLVDVEVLVVGTTHLDSLDVVVERHHSFDVLEAIVFDLMVAKIELYALLVVVQALSVVQVDCQTEEEATVAGKDGREN